MKLKHMILELPEKDKDLDKVISDQNHDIKHVSFSSLVVDNKIKHFVLVIWHDEEYGDHMF